MINAQVDKSGAESTLSVIRKFSRKVQGTGLIQTVRGRRYYERKKSGTVSKKSALKRIARHEKRRELIKEGKIIEREPRFRRGPQRESAASTTNNRSSGLGEATPIAR